MFWSLGLMGMNLLQLRKQKLAQDLISMERMRQQGIHPIDALDQLIHTTIELMSEFNDFLLRVINALNASI